MGNFCTAILNCLLEAFPGAVLKCSIYGDSISIVVYLFLDYYTIIQVSLDPYTSTDDHLKLSQKVLEIFLGEAQATGGKVVQSKKLVPVRYYLGLFREV